MNWTQEELTKLQKLRAEDGLSFKNIANKLNRSIGSVKSQYSRGLPVISNTNKIYTTEEIARNRSYLLKEGCYNKEFDKNRINNLRKNDKRFRKAYIYLIYFPRTKEMKVGVSIDVISRRTTFGYNITKLSYISTLLDRYIAEYIEGYILNRFKDDITYSNTIRGGGNSELFEYNINNIDKLIEDIELKLFDLNA